MNLPMHLTTDGKTSKLLLINKSSIEYQKTFIVLWKPELRLISSNGQVKPMIIKYVSLRFCVKDQ
jgi:hypothetical protein